MYCILVTGIPAAGKSTMARELGQRLNLPVISKDDIKELLFDEIGFRSRAEKVQLGVAAMRIMYQTAEALMTRRLPFILENNFEHTSRDGLMEILDRHSYTAVTVTLTGDSPTIYQRFVRRNASPDRHRGHVVNNCYPEKSPQTIPPPPSLEDFVNGFVGRGIDSFTANGPHIVVDTTDFAAIDMDNIVEQILRAKQALNPNFYV